MSLRSGHQINTEDLSWADLIMVMERRYKSRIRGTFGAIPGCPKIVSLDIPDEYEYMDAELIELIRDGVEFHLRQEFGME